MKTGTNFLLIGLLSLLIGSAFASPLLISELEIGEIEQLPDPPTGPAAEFSCELVYANFSTQPNPDYKSLVQMSYFVVVNVTNNSDDWANITAVQVDAEVEGYTMPEDDSGFTSTTEVGRGWNAKEAWVNGEYYNLTWVPNAEGFDYQGDSELEGYWMAGVQVYEHYINYEYAYTRMNMNGTWVDVSGRIEVELPSNWPPKNPVNDGTLFSEIKFLRGGDFMHMDIGGLQMPIGSPSGFDELWAPHQSRLIVLKDTRSVSDKYFEQEKLDLLTTQQTKFSTTVNGYLQSSTMWNSTGTGKSTTQVQLEQTVDGYQYSTLSENQQLVMDAFGTEAFIEPRN